MKEDLSSKIANWLISFSSFEEFEISNKNLNRLIWQGQKRWLILCIVPVFLLILMELYEPTYQFTTSNWEGRGRKRLVVAVVIGTITVFLILGQWIPNLNARRKLFLTYPELDHELANLVGGDYVDEALQAYVYGHHLVMINAGGGLNIFDLDCCQSLEIGSQIQSSGLKLYEVVTTLDNGRQVRFTVPDYPSVDTGQRLEELQGYINANY